MMIEDKNIESLEEFLMEDTPARLSSVKDSLFRMMSMAAQNNDNFVTENDKTNIHILYNFLSKLTPPEPPPPIINTTVFSEN